MVVGAIGIVASIIGTFFVRVSEEGSPQAGLNMGLWSTNVMTAAGVYFLSTWTFPGKLGVGVFLAIVAGLFVGLAAARLLESVQAAKGRPAAAGSEGEQAGLSARERRERD
jgi:K(+)-stimulated pyrophosphate-energized sodium pump